MMEKSKPARRSLATLSCVWFYSALVVICHSVINEGASVPVNDRLVTPTSSFIKDDFNVEDILSSPDASRILKDSSASAESKASRVVGAWPAQNRIESDQSTESTTGPTVESSSSSQEFILPTKMSPNFMSSPLHVARCRATCLEKFRMNLESGKGTDSLDEALNGTDSNLHPNLTWTCVESPDCSLCWKSCELLEAQDLTLSAQSFDETGTTKLNGAVTVGKFSKGLLPGKTGESTDPATKKQSILSCSLNKHCVVGCQVACSFYERLRESDTGTFSSLPTTHPVIAMKHETVLSTAQGKVTWPPSQESETSGVVYVVIQEYPDRKWRQVVQTTKTEVEIPSELPSSKSAKLQSVRVLVVGTNGLLSIYNPIKSLESKSDRVNNRTSSEGRFANENTPDVSTRSSTDATMAANDHQMGYANIPVTSSTDTPSPEAGGSVAGSGTKADPFNLRVVSLIHQKSLVIAELKWNGASPEQDYLITWELHGGGLKGHLVTDSTSVTLSLWPDTTYQIQVEKFEKKLESEVYDKPTSAKSLRLTVDTSTASFPLQPPSALRSGDSDEDSEDSYENEDLSEDQNKLSLEDPSHKSITPGGGFLNMTLFLGIAISALLFVLVILTVAAFTWTRMRAVNRMDELHNNGHRSGSPSLDWCSTSPMISPGKKFHCREDTTGSYCDCDGGDNTPYSYSTEPQSLLYSQEDYSWDECPYYHEAKRGRPTYSGFTSEHDHPGRQDIPYSFHSPPRRKENESCVAVISSGSNDLQMPSLAPSRYPPAISSSYLTSYYRGSSSIGYALLGEPTPGEACYYP